MAPGCKGNDTGGAQALHQAPSKQRSTAHQGVKAGTFRGGHSRYLLTLAPELALGLLLCRDTAGGLVLFLGGLADGQRAEEGGLDGGNGAGHQLLRGGPGRRGSSGDGGGEAMPHHLPAGSGIGHVAAAH
jgi:hypothetical protein